MNPWSPHAPLMALPIHGEGNDGFAEQSVRRDWFQEAEEILYLALVSDAPSTARGLVARLRRLGVSPGVLGLLLPALQTRIRSGGKSVVRLGLERGDTEDLSGLNEALQRLLERIAEELEAGCGSQKRRSCGYLGRCRRFLASASLLAMFGLVPSQSYASVADNPFAGLSAVSDHQLAHSRGGFMVAGVNVNFGAVVKTVVNGSVVLETQLTATNGGVVAVQSGPAMTSSTPIPGSPQLNVQVLGAAKAGAGTLVPGQNAANVLTAGVIITGPGGTSEAVSSFEPSSIVNAVTSNASNQAITQQVEINVTLSDFSALQSQIQFSQLGTNITNGVQSALLTSMPH